MSLLVLGLVIFLVLDLSGFWFLAWLLSWFLDWLLYCFLACYLGLILTLASVMDDYYNKWNPTACVFYLPQRLMKSSSTDDLVAELLTLVDSDTIKAVQSTSKRRFLFEFTTKAAARKIMINGIAFREVSFYKRLSNYTFGYASYSDDSNNTHPMFSPNNGVSFACPLSWSTSPVFSL